MGHQINGQTTPKSSFWMEKINPKTISKVCLPSYKTKATWQLAWQANDRLIYTRLLDYQAKQLREQIKLLKEQI